MTRKFQLCKNATKRSYECTIELAKDLQWTK